jgi:cytochrome c556
VLRDIDRQSGFVDWTNKAREDVMNSKILGGTALVATIAVFVTGVGVAQDFVGQRQAYMKSVARSAKAGSDMMKGSIPFDAQKAADAMATIAAGWASYVKLFPPGSDAGETRASPKIWQDFAGFEAKAKKLGGDAAAAQTAASNGADAFKAAFNELAKNCNSCHDDYRVQRK